MNFGERFQFMFVVEPAEERYRDCAEGDGGQFKSALFQAVGNRLGLIQNVRAGFQENRPGGQRQQNASEHGESASEWNRLVVDFSLAGVVHELDAQAPFAPERQREQRRHKRAREGGEKIVEGKSHVA